MAPTVEEAAKKASVALAGSASKDFKRESGTARLLGAGKRIIRGQLRERMLMVAQQPLVYLN